MWPVWASRGCVCTADPVVCVCVCVCVCMADPSCVCLCVHGGPVVCVFVCARVARESCWQAAWRPCLWTDLLLILRGSSVSSPELFKMGLGCGEILPTIPLALSLLVWASLRFIASGAGDVCVCVYRCTCMSVCMCACKLMCVFLCIHVGDTLLHFVKKDCCKNQSWRVN